jgi:tRNA (mo5U34)-methyltransferase
MGGTWTEDDIRQAISDRSWYHKINLGPGIVTPGLPLDNVWEMVRAVRKNISYQGKRVLDIASFDGMWAFEAEKLGASFVVATDCYHPVFSNFALCKDILKSDVVPLYNISPYHLWDGLKTILMDDASVKLGFPEQIRKNQFDIVQHLGLLYHVRDPLMTLSQARSVIKTGGYLLLESAAILNSEESFMLFNGPPEAKYRFYNDVTSWWAATVPCIQEMLKTTLFEPLSHTIRTVHGRRAGKYEIGRVCLVAKAIPGKEMELESYRELLRTFRNPGLVPDYL